jgi:hypothetical protein
VIVSFAREPNGGLVVLPGTPFEHRDLIAPRGRSRRARRRRANRHPGLSAPCRPASSWRRRNAARTRQVYSPGCCGYPKLTGFIKRIPTCCGHPCYIHSRGTAKQAEVLSGVKQTATKSRSRAAASGSTQQGRTTWQTGHITRQSRFFRIGVAITAQSQSSMDGPSRKYARAELLNAEEIRRGSP